MIWCQLRCDEQSTFSRFSFFPRFFHPLDGNQLRMAVLPFFFADTANVYKGGTHPHLDSFSVLFYFPRVHMPGNSSFCTPRYANFYILPLFLFFCDVDPATVSGSMAICPVSFFFSRGRLNFLVDGPFLHRFPFFLWKYRVLTPTRSPSFCRGRQHPLLVSLLRFPFFNRTI